MASAIAWQESLVVPYDLRVLVGYPRLVVVIYLVFFIDRPPWQMRAFLRLQNDLLPNIPTNVFCNCHVSGYLVLLIPYGHP